MGKPKAPEAPDPVKTASAQTGSNIGTAIANNSLNMVNQYTPDGSLEYEQTGSTRWKDPTSGEVYYIPNYSATQTLSEIGQQTKDANDQAGLNLANLASDQSDRLNSLLSAPVDLNNEDTEARLMELGRKRLDPALADRREDLRTNLSNQGIKLGTAAYDRAMSEFDQSRNDAYNQLLLQGRGQAIQEQLTERNQPINEITALMSGSQVSQPNFVNTPGSNIANTDYAGIVNSNYNQQMQGYNSQMNQYNAILGGLFGLGSAGIMAGF